MVQPFGKWRLRPTACAAVGVLALLSLAYRGEVLFKHRTYFHNDIYQEFCEFKIYLQSALHEGRIPLWCPEQFAGMPFLPNPQAGAFYPFGVLFLFMPFARALSLYFTVHTFLAGLFMYAFLGELRLSRWARGFGAILSMMSGFQAWEVIHPQTLAASLWSVPALYFVARSKRTGSLSCAWGVGACLAMSFLAGNPQMFLGGFYLVLAYALFHKPWSPQGWRPAGAWLGAWMMGLLLIAVMALPFIELAWLGQRSAGMAYQEATSFALPLKGLANLFCPFVGVPASENLYFIHQHAEELTRGVALGCIGYLGVVGFLMMVAGLFWNRRPPALFFLLFGLLTLWVCMGNRVAPFNLHRLLYDILPGMRFLRTPFRYLFLYNHCAAVLAALGAQAVFEKRRISVVGAGVALLVCLAALADGLGRQDFWGRFLSLHALPCVAVLLAAGACALPMARLRVFLLCALAAGELFWFMRQAWPTASDEVFDFPHARSLSAFLKSRVGDERVLIEKMVRLPGDPSSAANGVPLDPYLTLPANVSMLFGLKNASGYNQMAPARTIDFITQGDVGRRWMRVRYVVASREMTRETPMVWSQGLAAVYDLGPPLPRVWVVRQAKCVPEDDDAFAEVFSPTFDPTRLAILSTASMPRVSSPALPDLQDSVTLIEDRPEFISAQVTLSQSACLVFPDPFYPGWKAKVDGRPTRIFRTDFCFRGVFVPSGTHQVTFAYQPLSLLAGAILSLISLGSLGIIWKVFKKGGSL